MTQLNLGACAPFLGLVCNAKHIFRRVFQPNIVESIRRLHQSTDYISKMTVDKMISDPSLVAVLQVSDHARDQAYDLLQLVAQASARATPENHVEIAKQQKHLLTSISHLRGLHRNASFAARDTKTQTAERRQDVDRLHLQLQNLYYEQRHLQGEIVACESYEYVM